VNDGAGRNGEVDLPASSLFDLAIEVGVRHASAVPIGIASSEANSASWSAISSGDRGPQRTSTGSRSLSPSRMN